MKSNLTFIIFLLFYISNLKAQQEVILSDKDDLKLYYKLLLEEKGKSKDKYILIVSAENNSKTDLFYEVPLTKKENGELTLPFIPEELGFSKVTVRNSTGLFGVGQSLAGDQTNLITTNNSILFELKEGEIYTKETTFKVKTDVVPLITNTFSKKLNKLESFDLQISVDMLKGNYFSSCGNFSVNIEVSNSADKGVFLTQTSNGKQFVWLRKTETTFVRENSSEFTLSFNKSNKTFNYSTTDGINCVWEKK